MATFTYDDLPSAHLHTLLQAREERILAGDKRKSVHAQAARIRAILEERLEGDYDVEYEGEQSTTWEAA